MDITAALKELTAEYRAVVEQSYTEYVALRDPLKAACDQQLAPFGAVYQSGCDALYEKFGPYPSGGVSGQREYQLGRKPVDAEYRGKYDPAPAAYRKRGDALFAEYRARFDPIMAEYRAADDALHEAYWVKCRAAYDATAAKADALKASAAETMPCWSCQRVMLVSDGYGNAPCDDCQAAVNTAARFKAYATYTNQPRELEYDDDDEFETERSL